MRVIAGSARRLTLKTLDTMETRPTTDRIKETLFNMLQNDLYDTSFLDLFAGSGGIGIEALSRGAKKAVFVENNPKAAEIIKDNLKTTKFEDRADVLCCDVLTALRRLEGKNEVYDFVFMDPPYNQEHEKHILEYLATSNLIDEYTMIIIEASKETRMDYLEEYGFAMDRCKVYKTNQHFFVTREKKS